MGGASQRFFFCPKPLLFFLVFGQYVHSEQRPLVDWCQTLIKMLWMHGSINTVMFTLFSSVFRNTGVFCKNADSSLHVYELEENTDIWLFIFWSEEEHVVQCGVCQDKATPPTPGLTWLLVPSVFQCKRGSFSQGKGNSFVFSDEPLSHKQGLGVHKAQSVLQNHVGHGWPGCPYGGIHGNDKKGVWPVAEATAHLHLKQQMKHPQLKTMQFTDMVQWRVWGILTWNTRKNHVHLLNMFHLTL